MFGVVTTAIGFFLVFCRLVSADAKLHSTTAYNAPNSTGIWMQHGFETVLIQPYGYDGFRIRAWPFRAPSGNEVGFLYDPPLEGFENGKSHGMSFDMTIDGNGTHFLRNGNIIVRTFGPAQAATHLVFYRIEANGSETLLTNEYAPVHYMNPRYYAWDGPGTAFSAEFSFSTTPDEQIYGTGTQQDHAVNKKGAVIDLINFNTHITAPLFMSSKGYGFIWNSAAEGRLEFGQLRNKITSTVTTVADYVIVTAPVGDYDGLQRRLTAATGRAPTPPDFSLGFIQCKFRYANTSEVLRVAEGFHGRNIPMSMLVIDGESWAHQGDWALDPRYWTNLTGMTARVKELTGAEMMGSLWPSVEDKSLNYVELQKRGYLAVGRSGPGVIDSWDGQYIRNYDSTNPGARKFLWQQLQKHYYDHGIKNFWLDSDEGGNEGEGSELNGQSAYIMSIPYVLPDVLYAAGTQRGIGKLYPWAHQQAIEEGLRNATGTQEGQPCQYLSLSRSTYIGSQRFCGFIWSGDITAVWETLSAQVAVGLSAASTGWGWWTLDAGGFNNDPTVYWSNNVDEPQYQQLFVRWLQWSTFLPFMRTHGARLCYHTDYTKCPNEPWSYGESNTPIIVSYIHLRYTLGAYIRSVFNQFHETGRMIMRPLFMDFSQSDTEIMQMTANNSNFTTQQYLFGPRLLVTPVTLPNVTEWEVYLPRVETSIDKPWTYWWTNLKYSGGQVVKVPTPLEHIPLFHLGTRENILAGNVF